MGGDCWGAVEKVKEPKEKVGLLVCLMFFLVLLFFWFVGGLLRFFVFREGLGFWRGFARMFGSVFLGGGRSQRDCIVCFFFGGGLEKDSLVPRVFLLCILFRVFKTFGFRKSRLKQPSGPLGLGVLHIHLLFCGKNAQASIANM